MIEKLIKISQNRFAFKSESNYQNQTGKEKLFINVNNKNINADEFFRPAAILISNIINNDQQQKNLAEK